MVRVEKEYAFAGPEGRRTLRELFGDRHQLVVRHVMFDPSTSAAAAGRSPSTRPTAATSTTTNHVTLDESVAPVEYNYRTPEEHREAGSGYDVAGDQPIELPGASFFLRVGDEVFHTSSVYARGGETLGGSSYVLDMTALGRQEDRKQPRGRAAAVRAAVPDFAE
jgi:predicted dithiol-disulfide oxidoreductase (DUF899 family)